MSSIYILSSVSSYFIQSSVNSLTYHLSSSLTYYLPLVKLLFFSVCCQLSFNIHLLSTLSLIICLHDKSHLSSSFSQLLLFHLSSVSSYIIQSSVNSLTYVSSVLITSLISLIVVLSQLLLCTCLLSALI